MRLPIRLWHAVSAKTLDWRRLQVRTAIALFGVALFFVALHFYGANFLQFGIDYNVSEIHEAPSKLVLPDVWLP
jgi:Na+/proline symporter